MDRATWENVHATHFIPDPADPPEDRRSFGYEHMVVTRRARQWLRVARPELTEQELDREVTRAYERWGSARPSYAETSEVRRIRGEAEAENRWLSNEGERGGMTRAEWIMLRDHFSGANDPTAQSILIKAVKALGDSA